MREGRWQCSCRSPSSTASAKKKHRTSYYSITAPIYRHQALLFSEPASLLKRVGLEDWRLPKERRARVRVPCGALFSFFVCLSSRLLLPLSRLPTCALGESARALGPALGEVRFFFFFFFTIFALLRRACWCAGRGPGALVAGGSAPAHTPHTGARGVALEKKGKKGRRKRGGGKKGKRGKRGGKVKKLQHPDFARGHPPHYYLGQNVLNFADRTGCGALTIVWP